MAAVSVNMAGDWCKEALTVYKGLRDANALITQTAALALDVIITLGKVFKEIPTLVGDVGMVGLDIVGFLWVVDAVEDINKLCHDLYYSALRGEWDEGAYLVVKVALKVTDLFLLFTHGYGALLAVLGRHAAMKQLYSGLRPVGLASFFGGVAVTAVDLWRGERLYSALKALQPAADATAALPSDDEERRQTVVKVMRCFSAIVLGKEVKANVRAGDALALRTVRHLHFATLDAYEAKFRNSPLMLWDGLSDCDDEQEDFLVKEFDALVGSVEHTLWHRGGDLLLTGVGYAAMFIWRAFPDTTLQWCVTTGVAALWWVKAVSRYLHDRRLAADTQANAPKP